MSNKSLPQLRLKKGEDRRVRSGHPWVFSNEIQSLEPALGPVWLMDAKGDFVAAGVFNPKALISFRVVTRDIAVAEQEPEVWMLENMRSAFERRRALGMGGVSHRAIFAEGDSLPGLLVDAYRTDSGWVLVAQVQGAGMEDFFRETAARVSDMAEIFAEVFGASDIAIILRREGSGRKMEGLEAVEPEVFWADSAIDQPIRILGQEESEVFSRTPIRLRGASGELTMTADLLTGQKTGWFLDQADNIELVGRHVQAVWKLDTSMPRKTWKILDLFTHNGQWSAQLGTALHAAGVPVQILAADSSEKSLQLARANLKGRDFQFDTRTRDLLEGDWAFDEGSFDLVIVDPPALIRGKKSVGPGKHAYFQLFADSIKSVKRGGWIVACSCSGLFSEEEFFETLAKAERRAGRNVSWIARGGQSMDHPIRSAFPEGRYLKMALGRVD